mmetsp:Transcript_16413/g.37991  ORF Transcript_16413/g.37991 Transcript_16413/m.37991 type:complete len:118 (-) Transcript_16413:430-783(-)|eukprot:CAMPEP_0197181544 /NCGR_PEP_ID=MMETSP1423-20130617/5800_1 /TAXON_ID=476441 /ORGANISM="Pseudo-nitzschia heimii, Strain UNC1101" /LENGTH=117 /DNA_ID=CAMNT_0042631815 /DNA_START=288 /DNA_END=641 /DNA_ORIENTATION=-
MTANSGSGDGGGDRIQEDITAVTGKITGFISDKIDDVKHQMETRQRKFEISGESSGLDRTKADVTRWFKNEKEDVKEGFKNLASNLGVEKDGDEKSKDENEAGCGACAGGGCGLFST